MLLQKNERYLLLYVIVAVLCSSAFRTSLMRAVSARSYFSCLCHCRKQGSSMFDSHSLHPSVN